MASNTTPSYPKKLILKIKISSPASSSPKLPPTPSSESPPPSSPLPPLPGFTLESPPGSSLLSPELKLFYDQIFTALPQTPHLNPLERFTSDLKGALKLGLDIAFLNFVKKFQNLVDPISFLSDLENLAEEFEDFDKLGYDLTEIKERFNLLRKAAEDYKESKDKVGKLDEAKREKEAEVEEKEYRLMELAEKRERVANQVKIQESEIEEIDDQMRKIENDITMNGYEFRILANNPW